jgi:hypothetical protein
MFEQIRASLRDLLHAARSPADRRAVLGDMKQTLVQARLGIEDLRKGLDEARARADAARHELDTIRRRRELAAKIGDTETVAVADRFERLQAERVAVLDQKLDTQQRELALLEHEVAEMTAEFKRAAAGAPVGPAAAASAGGVSSGVGANGVAPDAAERAAAREVDDLLNEDGGLAADIGRLARDRERATRESDADERLAALKRRMGK